jgi:hypothetical protein
MNCLRRSESNGSFNFVKFILSSYIFYDFIQGIIEDKSFKLLSNDKSCIIYLLREKYCFIKVFLVKLFL